MEYSFVHFAGVLWTAAGPRRPDWTLWHADLPMHPSDPRTPVVLNAALGLSTTATAFDLASVLLQQQPSGASSEEDGKTQPAAVESKDAPPKPRPMGSVAALTSGMRPNIESPETGIRARAALGGLLQGFDTDGWFTIEFDKAAARPWVISASKPPANFNQKPKAFAKKATASRHAELLVEELKYAHAGMMLQMARKQVKLRQIGARNFTAIELLLLANATERTPTSLVA